MQVSLFPEERIEVWRFGNEVDCSYHAAAPHNLQTFVPLGPTETTGDCSFPNIVLRFTTWPAGSIRQIERDEFPRVSHVRQLAFA